LRLAGSPVASEQEARHIMLVLTCVVPPYADALPLDKKPARVEHADFQPLFRMVRGTGGGKRRIAWGGSRRSRRLG
jgi:hypothetical protein